MDTRVFIVSLHDEGTAVVCEEGYCHLEHLSVCSACNEVLHRICLTGEDPDGLLLCYQTRASLAMLRDPYDPTDPYEPKLTPCRAHLKECADCQAALADLDGFLSLCAESLFVGQEEQQLEAQCDAVGPDGVATLLRDGIAQYFHAR